MLGAIIGDIVGSVYEFDNIKTKEFPLFAADGEITDDSILSVATADWLMYEGESGDMYVRYAKRYPHPKGGYGSSFLVWVQQSLSEGRMAAPYNSCGNGSAMRVGPVGWAFESREETLEMARLSAECTHNHPEGIKGAQATALCIYMARHGATKEEIRYTIQEMFGYDLRFTCDEIRNTYGWEPTCQKSVPQAIVAFLDGNDFEDCLRNAVSIGGDSDTIACITGSIAEAYYDIPKHIRERALSYIPRDLQEVIFRFEKIYGKRKRFYRGVERPLSTPGKLSSLKEDEIFVFGSNLAGMHGGGAARAAMERFGAVWGQGVGLQGQSYAIPTMHGGVEAIRPYVQEFIRFAHDHKELFFYVTRIGCGIAGFRDEEIAPLFADAVREENICLPRSFRELLI